jgi:hypothetical protein
MSLVILNEVKDLCNLPRAASTQILHFVQDDKMPFYGRECRVLHDFDLRLGPQLFRKIRTQLLVLALLQIRLQFVLHL